MEIRLLHRKQINEDLWNARVEQSGNSLPYALSGYLDVVTNRNWSALVSGDYESIFPLPYEIKLGLKMYLQPPFTQQLGLISEDHSSELLSNFLDAIPNDFSTVFLKGNEYNFLGNHASVKIKNRTNYLLDLKSSYDIIFANFSKSLRKRIRKGKGYYQILKSTNVNGLVDFYQEQMHAKVGLNKRQYDIARKLFGYLIDSGWGEIYVANHQGKEDAMLLVVKYQNRIINLFGTSNAQGKNHFAMHLILDSIMEEKSGGSLIFDFEGSDLVGVKEFYESFGPKRYVYPEFHIDNSPLWLKLAKGIKRIVSS